MAKTAVVAKITALEGKRDEVVGVLRRLVEAARDEPGTEVYVLNTADDDPEVIWFYELYTDQSARQEHGGSETMKQVGGALRDLAAGRPEIIALTPVAAAGLDI